jgi:hypothetical protein
MIHHKVGSKKIPQILGKSKKNPVFSKIRKKEEKVNNYNFFLLLGIVVCVVNRFLFTFLFISSFGLVGIGEFYLFFEFRLF